MVLFSYYLVLHVVGTQHINIAMFDMLVKNIQLCIL